VVGSETSDGTGLAGPKGSRASTIDVRPGSKNEPGRCWHVAIRQSVLKLRAYDRGSGSPLNAPDRGASDRIGVFPLISRRRSKGLVKLGALKGYTGPDSAIILEVARTTAEPRSAIRQFRRPQSVSERSAEWEKRSRIRDQVDRLSAKSPTGADCVLGSVRPRTGSTKRATCFPPSFESAVPLKV